MVEPAVTVITPTIGRASLAEMLRRLVPQLGLGDEVIVIGDGPQPKARTIVDGFPDANIRYAELGPFWRYGTPQRDMGIRLGTRNNYLAFVDDDDAPLPGYMEALRRGIREADGRPLVYRIEHSERILWRDRRVRAGNISGQMFVVQNVPGKVGRWGDRYAGDFDFVQSTLALQKDGEASVLWREEVILRAGIAGPKAAEAVRKA